MERAIQPDSRRPQADDRRLVTVLFVDVPGFCLLAEASDTEGVRDLLHEVFGKIEAVVEQFGGLVDKVVGDRLMAVFGAPVSDEHHADMAVLAAMAIRPVIADFNRRRSVDLPFHAGLNTGLVVAGTVGAGPRRAYSVIGDSVNVASRLCELSEPGEILVGSETRRLLGDHFNCDEAEHAPLRGRREAVSVYRVQGPNPGWSQSTGGRFASAFVGRDVELRLVRQAEEKLARGTGALLFVAGDAGVGKTRLTSEIRLDAARQAIRWIEYRAPLFGLHPAHSMALSLLESDLGLVDGESASSRRHKIAQRTDRPFADRAADVSGWLEELIGVGSDASPEPGPLSVDALPDLWTEVCAYFGEVASIEPIVMCFDDVQWLDASSLALLGKLISLAATHPILFLLVGRHEPRDVWNNLRQAAASSRPAHLTEISLAPLSKAETRELLSNLLAPSRVPLEIEQTVNEKAEGNPFFVEELLRHLIDLRLLVREPGRQGFHLAGNLTKSQIPNTVRGVIASRLDRLPAPHRQRLREASIIGRSFSCGLLAAVAGEDAEEVARQLADLQALELVALTNDRRFAYCFQHPLVQEVTYESVLLKERKELHRQVGEAAQRLFPENTPGLPAFLAYHFSRSEDWEKAQPCLVEAAAHAMRVAADTDALAYYEQAMSALLMAFEQDWEARVGDPVQWFLDQLEPLWQMRRLDRLLEPALLFQRRLSERCGAHDARTLAAQGIVAGCYVQAGSYPQAIDLIQETLARWKVAAEHSEAAEARLLLLLGIAYRNQDQYPESEKALRRALILADSDTRIRSAIVPVTILYLSSVLYLSGRVREDKQLIEEALERPEVRQSGHYWDMQHNLIETLVTLGEWEEAVALGRRCLAETENPYARAHVLENLGLALHACRQLDEAEEVLTRAVQAFEQLRKTRELAEGLRELAETQLTRTEVADAERSAERALSLMDELGWPSDSERARVLLTNAAVEGAKGNLDMAQRHLEQSRRAAIRSLGRLHPFQAELFYRTAEMELRRGRRERSAGYLRRATRMLAELGGGDHPRIRQMEKSWKDLAKELTVS